MGGVRSVVARANQRVTIQLAAGLLAGSTLVSSFLGIYKYRLLNAHFFGVYPASLDAYTAAFMIPDFMFFILVSGALSVTFIPVFNQRLVAGNKKSAWELSTSLINLMALATLAASILIMIFADPLVRVGWPGFSESTHDLAVSMMRVIAVNPFLFAVATVIASMQQAVGRYVFYTLAPTIYNIGIIIGIVYFTNGITIFGWHVFDGGIMGVALGVVLGSMMQLVVSSIGLMGLGFDYRFKIFWKNRGFRRVLKLLPARSLDQGGDYLNGFVEGNIASKLGTGTLYSYSQAITLHSVPINLIGVAISNAAFPRMTERLAEKREDLFKSELQTVLRVIVWLALPVAAVTYFTRGYLVNFLINGGDDVIAGLLGALVVAILFRSVYHIAARTFYARQDTKTPLYVSFFMIALNIILAVWFTAKLGLGVYGLAWAQSIVAAVEVFTLFIILGFRVQGLIDMKILKAFGRMLSATGFMALASYVMVLLFQLQSKDRSFLATFPKFAVIVAVSAMIYITLSKFLHLEEATPVIRRLRSWMLAGLNR